MYAVISVAKSEVGYKEKLTSDVSQFYDKTANAGLGNYTKYTHEFDNKYPTFYSCKLNPADWCDIFVDWCFVTALGEADAREVLCQPLRSGGAGCAASANYYKEKGRFKEKGTRPKQGYQIFFSRGSGYYHTGLVWKVDRDYVYTIEGNTDYGEVAYKTYALGDSKIGGYGVPRYELLQDKLPYLYRSFQPSVQIPEPPNEYRDWVFPIPIDSLIEHPTYHTGAFGWRVHPIDGGLKFHEGVDLSAPQGTEIYAAHAGEVSGIGFTSGGGNTVTVNHGKLDGKHIYTSSYLHMVERPKFIEVGTKVDKGALIGHVGSTGNSSGPHLHFEIRIDGVPVDPAEYIYQENFNSLFEKTASIYDTFKPLYDSNSVLPQFEGNMSSWFHRRGHILSDNESQLLQYGSVDKLFYGGVSPCGYLSVGGASSVDLIASKEAVTKAVYDESTKSYRMWLRNDEDKLTVAKYIYGYLSDKGWSPNAIYALLGNIQRECQMNPAYWEGAAVCNTRDAKIGFGLIQWTPWNKFHDWAGSRGLDPYDIDAQLQRIELGIDYGKLQKGSTSDALLRDVKKSSYYTEGSELEKYIKTTDNKSCVFDLTKEEFTTSLLPVEVLTCAYMFNAEQPSESGAKTTDRIQFAKEYESKLSGGMAQRSTSPTGTEQYWLKKNVVVDKVKGVNPYPVVSDNTTLPNNNAYCWGRAYEIVSTMTSGQFHMADSIEKDWYEDALNSKIFECGKIPRVGSIICWKYNRLKTGNKKASVSYVGVVEQVLGNDSIVVSTMLHDCRDKEIKDAFEYRMMNNTNSNWGLEPSEYEFRGFIYLLDISVINKYTSSGKVLSVESSSKSCKYNSLSIGINDIKHFNTMKIVYDLTVTPPTETEASLNKVKELCGFYITMSQRVNNYNGEMTEDWKTSFLTYTQDEYDDNDNHIKKTYFEGPFPHGVIFLRNKLPESLFNSRNYNQNNKTYKLSNITDVVSLDRANVRGTYTDVFNEADWAGYSENKNVLRRFNRQLQTYLGVTTVADTYENYLYTFRVDIKQIILYR